MIQDLKIDGVSIPTETIAEFDQTYEDIAGETFRRTADGSGILRSGWSGKISTTISGKGWAPIPLSLAARGSTHLIACAMVDAVDSATTTVTVPAARRTDSGHSPIGFAWVGDHLVETPITNIADIDAKTTNDATLTAVAGAVAYRVHYWPELTVRIATNNCKGASLAAFTWQIEAEQI